LYDFYRGEAMDFFTVVYFFGGLGLFIFGMMIMGQSLEKIAGNKLSEIIGKLTVINLKGCYAVHL
jgi:phosphate:Na+ symporter